MSSKREQLKRMRNAQKTSQNTETPAEDYSNNAAKALEAEQKVPSEPLKTALQNAQMQVTPERTASENPSFSEVSALVDAAPVPERVVEEQAPVTPSSPVAAPLPSEPETVSTPNPTDGAHTPYSIANEPGKRISVSLRTENKNWMHRTAIRCGLSIQDYVNLLIEEAWEREKAHPFVWNADDPLPERIPSSKTVLVAIKLTDKNIERSKRMRASHCMTMTYYMNYLIEEECKREQQEGMRPPVFDDL